ncbi:MAG TPA: aldo/keto reductase [Parabacteroides sp.]|nr:aldo/keto reductase [Parabacteroides sp.]
MNGVQVKTEEDSTPANIRLVCENSLRNLGVETLGMFYQHRLDPNTPIEMVADTCGELIKEGKILHWGMCEVNAETIRRAHKVCPVTAIQSEYHFMHRTVEENGVLALCEELGIGFVPYSPLNRGFLGGLINEYTQFDASNDNRQTLPRFQPEAIRDNYRIVEVLNAFGRIRGITPAQISLAWLMNKKPFIVPIPGTTKLSHLEENLRACDIVFSAEDMAELEKAVAAIPVVGSRYDALQESKIQK